MNYVRHYDINGISTKQIPCVELRGEPNAATEGAVGVLAIDMDSPTHEVYKCVGANNGIYTWELLSGTPGEGDNGDTTELEKRVEQIERDYEFINGFCNYMTGLAEHPENDGKVYGIKDEEIVAMDVPTGGVVAVSAEDVENFDITDFPVGTLFVLYGDLENAAKGVLEE